MRKGGGQVEFVPQIINNYAGIRLHKKTLLST